MSKGKHGGKGEGIKKGSKEEVLKDKRKRMKGKNEKKNNRKKKKQSWI